MTTPPCSALAQHAALTGEREAQLYHNCGGRKVTTSSSYTFYQTRSQPNMSLHKQATKHMQFMHSTCLDSACLMGEQPC